MQHTNMLQQAGNFCDLPLLSFIKEVFLQEGCLVYKLCCSLSKSHVFFVSHNASTASGMNKIKDENGNITSVPIIMINIILLVLLGNIIF